MSGSAPRLRRPVTVPYVVASLVGFLLFLWVTRRTQDWPLSKAAPLILAISVGSYLAVLPHEFGHAVTARLFGRRVVEIRMGVPGMRQTRRISIFGMPLVFGTTRPGTGGHTRYEPPLPPAERAVVLLAGPIAGAAALAIAAAIIPSTPISDGLLIALVTQTIVNLLPDLSGRSNSDGTQLMRIARGPGWTGWTGSGHLHTDEPARRAWNQAAAASDRGDPTAILQILDQELAKQAVPPDHRCFLLGQRALHRYRAGWFLAAAEDYAGLPDAAHAWADAIVAAALFQQIPPDSQIVPVAGGHIEARAAVDSSLAAGHALAVLRILQGRYAQAFDAAARPGLELLAEPEQAAVAATRFLCNGDPATRQSLIVALQQRAPWSPWTRLAAAQLAAAG